MKDEYKIGNLIGQAMTDSKFADNFPDYPDVQLKVDNLHKL